MNKTNGRTRASATVRRPVLLGLFAGSAVGLGFLLAGIPNVELMTVTCALAGAVLGPVLGAVCGAVAMTAYSLGSPYGAAVPLLLLGQALGMALAGVIGAWGARPVLALVGNRRRLLAAGLAGGLGCLAAVVYDVLSNTAIILALEFEPRVAVAAAIPLALVHLGVNLLVFAVVLPTVLPRLAHLSGPSLIGRYRQVGVWVLLIVCGGVGISAAEEPTSRSWQRPLWEPFFAHTLDWLDFNSPLVVMTDGALGASTVLLDEAGTSPAPVFLFDGLPVGTGHALADDPWLVMLQGAKPESIAYGPDGWGGTDGVIRLAVHDPTPEKAYSVYRGVKGPHETYHRAVSLLTPAADWRLAFDFEENLDNEGYNFGELPDENFFNVISNRGHAKLRSGRGRLVRRLNEDSSLSIAYGTTRKTKDELPVWGAEHQEIWGDRVVVTARGRSDRWRWRSSFFFTGRDVQWGDRESGATVGDGLRKLETGREGMLVELQRPQRHVTSEVDSLGIPIKVESVYAGTTLRLTATNWRLHDSGLDRAAAGTPAGPIRGDGQTADLSGRQRLDLGSVGLDLRLAADWDDSGGLMPSGEVSLGRPVPDSWWLFSASIGGRAPRSDELLTPMERNVIGASLLLAPNPDLVRERTLRFGLLLRRRLLGTEVAVEGSWRRLTDGITWRPDPGALDEGMWANDLDLDATRVTARLERAGRFLGWGRARLEGTWRSFEEKTSRAASLPPRRSVRAALMWENHFFQEDGILQLAYYATYRSAMDDPWDPSRSVTLPAGTRHDLLIGFRLVGAHLSLALRNLTDQRLRLSSASLSPGREMRWRLNWTFYF